MTQILTQIPHSIPSQMQRTFRLAAYLFILIASAASTGFAKPLSQKSVLQLPHQTYTLPNGLRLFLVKYPSPGAVAYQLTVRAGSRNEIEKGKTGFAHFFEHLMFRGTKKLSSKEFGDLYTKLGCENNASTDYDLTTYHGIVASVYLPEILAAEADRFAHLAFDEKSLRDEAGAVLGEYNKDAAQPEFQLEEKLMATAFTKHPYSHTTMGYKEDVLQFTERYKDVWPFFQRYYRPENVFITLVGDIDFKAMTDLVQKQFGSWKSNPADSVTIPAEDEQTEARKAEVRLDKPSQTRAVVAYKIPAFSTESPDSVVIDILSELIFSVTSPFQKEFHFDKKWLDLVSTTGQAWVNPGLWQIWVRLTQAGEGKEAQILEAIEKTIAQVRTTPPSRDQLSILKRRFRNQALSHWFASPENLSATLVHYMNFETDMAVIDRVLNRVERLTPENLTEFARKHLIDSHKTTVLLKGAGK